MRALVASRVTVGPQLGSRVVATIRACKVVAPLCVCCTVMSTPRIRRMKAGSIEDLICALKVLATRLWAPRHRASSMPELG